jgi:hypothetical protein
VERAILVAVSIAWLGGWTALAVLAVSRDGGQGGARAARSQSPPSGGIRGCGERVEGERLAAAPQRDAVIGPATFVDAPGTYRGSFRGRDYVTPDYLPGLNAHPMKVLALVEGGARVRLVVPRRQRRWMRLFYNPGDDRGQHAMTLQACRTHTQFDGGLYIDFENAPQGGRCAELAVKVAGQSTTYRGRLFGPRPRECRDVPVRVSPRAGRPATVFKVSFRGAARLGVFGDHRRSYRASVRGPDRSACLVENEAVADRGRPRRRLEMRLTPGREKGMRWCRGRFHGRLARVDNYACPDTGVCAPPAGFPRREREVGRFSFEVR